MWIGGMEIHYEEVILLKNIFIMKAVKKVEDKFRLDLDDEQAVKFMEELIDKSVTAIMPQLVEWFHARAMDIKT